MGELRNIFRPSQDELMKRESSLANKLKQNCNVKGKEIYPLKSAKIFHQMGILYKRRSNAKVSLIRCAALLNAAVVRKQSKKISEDLQKFCFKVLKIANAKDKEANLVEIAKEVAKKIEVMRINVTEYLKILENIPYDIDIDQLKRLEEKKIEDIRSLLNLVADHYMEIMRYIADTCEKIMGKAPCKYALTGMGSLARKEITPYSDFEHIILLEEGVQEKQSYQATLEYFRWFSVIFQIIVINLKETIVPSVAIPSLNDLTKLNGDWFFDAYTPRGVSFDGLMPHACKSPLGRMEETKAKPWTIELIKPISDMSRYLDSNEDLKNQYHLSDILMKTCFVSGSEEIYNTFACKVRETFENNKDAVNPQLVQQLHEDLQNVDIYSNLDGLYSVSKCNIKRVVYRSVSLFLSALGRIHSIDAVSSFDIINHLQANGIIDSESAHQLAYALSVACHFRLKVYSFKQSQDDYVGQEELYDILDNNLTTELAEIEGERSMVDYFVIAYCLQKELKTHQGRLTDLKLAISPKLSVRFMVLFLLHRYDRLVDEWHNYLEQGPPNTTFDDDLWIRYYVARTYFRQCQYYKSFVMMKQLHRTKIDELSLKGWVIVRLADCLRFLGRYENSLAHIEEAKPTIGSLAIPQIEKNKQLLLLAHVKGDIKFSLGFYREAMSSFEELLEFLEKPGVIIKEIRKAAWLMNIGRCLFKLADYEAAKDKVYESIEIYKHNSIPVKVKCDGYHLLGDCCLKQNNYDEALQHYQTELDLRLRYGPKSTQNSAEDIDIVKCQIQDCEEEIKQRN